MKINEAEELVGITKKNIRFYEEQGLLMPRRNADNGYRDYGDEEIRRLRQIKLLRKLGVPIEEIRQMFSGTHTLGDGLRRHLITLDRERQNLEQSIQLCRELQSAELTLDALDAAEVLARMEDLEKHGATFQNKQRKDIRIRYVAPVVVTFLVVGLMLTLSMFMIWAAAVDPSAAPPQWVIAVFIGLFLAVGAGTVLALIQRIREIEKGEIDDAKYY
ncbi:MAG: MerR family transcriptional regulator [Clostridia bacterium]|nr:MerR family transcriptional regulator [Clostridia bacterium]